MITSRLTRSISPDEAILAYLDNPTPTDYAYPSEVAGESFHFLSSAQLLDLTELSDQQVETTLFGMEEDGSTLNLS